MTWTRIFLILLAVIANLLIIYYDLMVRENSLLRKLKLHKIFSSGTEPDDTIEELNTTDCLNIEIHRVIDNLRRKYGALKTINSSTPYKQNNISSRRRKVVLQYTAIFDKKPWPWMSNSEEFNHWHGVKCPYYDCELVFSRRERPRSDALLFHSRDMPPFDTLSYIQERKDSRQRWIFFSKENPMNNPPSRKYDLLFNWTLSYKHDSDIFLPYGYYFPVKRRKIISLDKIVKGKKKLVFWTSSHCGLKRDDYVKELMKYIKVDVIGSCAATVGTNSLDCPQNNKACEDSLETYKFQLAFENTNCVDYVTEKYWHSLKHGTVPVVMGGGDYGPAVAIPGSYINVMNFSSVEALANYLTYLDNNDAAYKEYFKWRQDYMITTFPPWNCILCARLYLDDTPKVYKTLDGFWGAANNCGYTETDKKLYRMLHKDKSSKRDGNNENREDSKHSVHEHHRAMNGTRGAQGGS